MNSKILGGALARTAARALGPVVGDLVYQVVTQTHVDEAKPWLGTTEKVTAHPCKGYATEFSRFERASSLVGADDLRVIVLRDTLAVEPTTSGRVVVDGRTLSIADVRSDPAGAIWDLRVRA